MSSINLCKQLQYKATSGWVSQIFHQSKSIFSIIVSIAHKLIFLSLRGLFYKNIFILSFFVVVSTSPLPILIKCSLKLVLYKLEITFTMAIMANSASLSTSLMDLLMQLTYAPVQESNSTIGKKQRPQRN